MSVSAACPTAMFAAVSSAFSEIPGMAFLITLLAASVAPIWFPTPFAIEYMSAVFKNFPAPLASA